MTVSHNRSSLALSLAAVALLAAAGNAPAQYADWHCPTPAASYYYPSTSYYYAPMTTSYYTPPSTAYYTPSTSYYYPSTSYYVPSTSYYSAPWGWNSSYYSPSMFRSTNFGFSAGWRSGYYSPSYYYWP
jgi:hypothetical protein